MKWSEFAAQAPELAGLGIEGFGEQNLCLIGTLRADGWPRISPTEIYFVDGELMLGMMPQSKNRSTCCATGGSPSRRHSATVRPSAGR
ncbi:MAG: hypothetical protein H0W81_11400 [Chloroflexi bacterium]|nr:hypothetical protein [Chloroflexota bacterium]